MAYILPPTLTSQLQAVNALLAAIGEAPVSSLDTAQSATAGSAANVLEEMLKTVQTEGWPWNREWAMELTPDVNGEIQLPGNHLRVTKTYPGNHSGSITSRAGKLYDSIEHSFVFADAVVVDLIVKLAFEDLPEAARRYIVIRAAQYFQGLEVTSAGVDRVLQDEVNHARVILEQEADDIEPQNSIAGNSQIQSRLSGPLRRRGV